MDIWHIGLTAGIIILFAALVLVWIRAKPASESAAGKSAWASILCAFASLIKLLRPNILILATFVFVIIICLVIALMSLIYGEGKDDFLKGALIGLIGAGITALTALGNNILEKDSKGGD